MNQVTGTTGGEVQPSINAAQLQDLKELQATNFHFAKDNGLEWNKWLDTASRSRDPQVKAQYREIVDLAGGRTDRPSLLNAMKLAHAYFTANGPNATAADKQALLRSMETNLYFQFGRLSPTELMTAPLQSAAATLLANSEIGKTEWGASLQKAFAMDASFRRGLAEGVWRGGKDMVTGIASMVGKAIQFSADTSAAGIAGDALRGITGRMPGWLEATIPSNKRAQQNVEVLGEAMKNAASYLSSHTASEIAGDIADVIGKQWDSLKASHAKAAAQGPVAEARWWGQTIGRVGFEIGATFIPVAGIAGKASKGAKAADAVGDAVRGADKAGDIGRITTKTLARMTFAELTEGLAKTSGKEALEFADEIAKRSTHQAGNTDRVVLGKWPGYINEARTNGGKWYETPSDFFDQLKVHAGDAATEKAWQVNEAFLRQQLGSGVQKIEFTAESLTHATTNRQSFTAREIRFLASNAPEFGYIKQGSAWVQK